MMDQQTLEEKDIGFRCRGCGISVFGRSDDKLCTACASIKAKREHKATAESR